MGCCDIFEKFQVDRFVVFESQDWLVAVRHKQITLGSCVVILKRHCLRFGELTAGECEGLHEVYSRYEDILISAFAPVSFNYLGLMMKDPHVHFHAIPRYSRPVDFAGRAWVDDAFPESVSMKQELEPEATRQLIKARLTSVG